MVRLRASVWAVGVLLVCALALGGCARSACCASPCSDPCGAAAVVGAGPAVVAQPAVVAAVPSEREAAPGIWDSLLRKYVAADYFDYARLKANAGDMARFRRFLDWQGKADVQSMSRADQIAFYINAYNSLNVKMIVEHYPVHTPMDIPGYFDKIKHPVGGEMLTVAETEYDRLIANYKDMRAHFAVVCSDRGCLPLKGSAWKGATLDQDLNAAARKFVADERQFKIDREKGEVHISKIFEWYGPKFTQDPTRPAAKPELFLTHWLEPEDKRFLQDGKYDLKIIEWNWTINEQRKN